MLRNGSFILSAHCIFRREGVCRVNGVSFRMRVVFSEDRK